MLKKIPALQQLYTFKTQHSPTSEVLILILLNTGNARGENTP